MGGGSVHEWRDPQLGHVRWGSVLMFRTALQPQPQPKARRRSTEWMRDPLAQCLAYYCPVARANRVFLYTSASKPDVGKKFAWRRCRPRQPSGPLRRAHRSRKGETIGIQLFEDSSFVMLTKGLAASLCPSKIPDIGRKGFSRRKSVATSSVAIFVQSSVTRPPRYDSVFAKKGKVDYVGVAMEFAISCASGRNCLQSD